MALNDPTAPFDPFALPTFDEDAFLAAMAPPAPVDDGLNVTLGPRGRDAAPTTTTPPPAPPPPPAAGPGATLRGRGGATRSIGQTLAPTTDELPAGALAQPLTPEEESQIEIDQPKLTPDEEAQIEIEPPPYAVQPVAAPTVQLPFAADATSGVDQRAPDGAFTSTAPMPTERPIEELQGEEQGRRILDLARTDPEKFQEYLLTSEKAKADKELAEMERIAADDRRRAEADRKMVFEAKQKAEKMDADVQADAAELGKQKVDPNHWWSSRSTGQKVAGFIAAIVGGLVQSRNGGRNVGLDIINKAIDDDINAQAANIANKGAALKTKQGIVAELYARTGDLERSTEAARRAAKLDAMNQLEIEMQKFDRNGSMYRNLALQLAQARQAQAVADQKWKQQQFENGIKTGELALKAADYKLKADKAVKAGAGAEVYKPEYFVAKGLKAPPFPMSEKDYGLWQSQQKAEKDINKGPNDKSEAQVRKEEADAVEAEAKAEAAKTGYALKNPETGQLFTNPDGSPVVEMDATKRNRASGIVEAAANIRRLADRMAALKKKYGGALESLGSDEAQEIKNLTSMIDFETFKAFDLGAPSEGDKALAEGVRGGASPTSFIKNATAGFQAYAENVERKANTALRSSGYKGPTLRFHREADAPVAKKTVVDELGEKLTKALHNEAPVAESDDPGAQFAAKAGAAAQQIFHPTDEKQVNEWLDQMAAFAEARTDQGDLAREYLKNLSKRAVSADLRKRIKTIVDNLPGANQRTDEAR